MANLEEIRGKAYDLVHYLEQRESDPDKYPLIDGEYGEAVISYAIYEISGISRKVAEDLGTLYSYILEEVLEQRIGFKPSNELSTGYLAYRGSFDTLKTTLTETDLQANVLLGYLANCDTGLKTESNFKKRFEKMTILRAAVKALAGQTELEQQDIGFLANLFESEIKGE